MKKKFKILGIIPARAGSKGIKDKNIKIVNGKPLIGLTIEEARKSNLDRLVVVTDSSKISNIAKKFGAEVPFKRPKKISKDNSHAFQIYKYTLNWLKKNENYIPDAICVMLCTTPFRNYKKINEALELIRSKKYDWIFSINEIEHHPYRAMKKVGEKIKPYFNISNKILWSNRQELPKLYRFNGGIIAGLSKNIFNYNEYNIDNLKYDKTKIGYVEMRIEDSLDIDTENDLNLAKLIYEKK